MQNRNEKKKVIPRLDSTILTQAGVPIHHSLPGATNVIYLNFVGGVVSGTQWNIGSKRQSWSCKPMNFDNNMSFFSPSEQVAISSIWNRVAEDYSPWMVDVTTENPNSTAKTVGEVMITSSTDLYEAPLPSSAAGGAAYINVFNTPLYRR